MAVVDSHKPQSARFCASEPVSNSEEHEAFREHRPPLRRARNHAHVDQWDAGRGIPARALTARRSAAGLLQARLP